MVLFDEKGNPKLYDSSDFSQIIKLVAEIRYAEGFIESVSWDANPTETNFEFSKHHAGIALKSIKKYEEIAPEELKREFDFSNLEKKCKKILKK